MAQVSRLLTQKEGVNNKHTSNTSEQLTSKTLDLAIGERDEVVAFEKIEDARPKKIHDDAYMTSEVEAITKMDASVTVVLVVGFQGL